jgi:peptidoglycan/xylan/chitin deacetylase (PgdA/CDA1 family)
LPVDAGQIDELRIWGRQLSDDESHPELQPAGRAILLLIDEVERLQGEQSPQEPPSGDCGTPEEEPKAEGQPKPPSQTRRFLGRLHRFHRLAVAAVVLGALVFATFALGAKLSAPGLDPQGPAARAAIGPATLPSLKFSVGADQSVLDRVRWKIDGADVTGRAYMTDGRFVLDGDHLRDGMHRVQATAPGGFPGSRATKTWTVRVDTVGPKIAFDPPGVMIPWGHPVVLAGTLEPQATLTADGRPVLVSNGRFRLAWTNRPKGAVTLVATDPLRNATTRHVWISMQPRRPAHPVRAVHVTFDAWADPKLRKGVIDLIDQGRVNAVELDLKDESGTVGWNAPVPLAHRIGAVKPIVDLPEAVAFLHRKGMRVIGRLVCFRDPIQADAAWSAGRRDEVIQTPDGQKYGGYGGFTNFASPAVRQYQIAIAVAAAKAGVDDVLYDYVRRPDGPLSTMTFPRLKGTPEQAIASFLAETRSALKPYGTYLGASVFGVAATRPTEVAQDIPMMASHVDYISAMVYPSHWARGEYGVPDPNAQPYEIVQRSLEDFQRDVRGTGARLVPWLQDFTLGSPAYGPRQVRGEIRGAHDAGIDEYLLWDPAVTYTAKALPTDAMTAAFPKRQKPAQAAKLLKPNELGDVPVLMHHQIRPHGGSFDLTAGQFRAELTRLWADGFYPVRSSDLVSGRLDVPKGRSPVLLTFDDATNNQIAFGADGKLDPDSAVGILEDFAARHPDFPATGTFYVPRNAFEGNGATARQTFRWLLEHGFELGNHTKDHTALNTLGATGVQRQLVLGDRLLSDRLPGYRPQTMALPFGALPHPASLAVGGRWDGESYRFAGVFLSGAEPAPSPFSTKWNPNEIPRIVTNPRWHGARDFSSGMWLDLLERNHGLRYVSDGDSATISFPRGSETELATRYRDRARPY